MGLSTNEVLLILRARDEATRTIGRVSGAMSRMDRDAVVSSKRMVGEQQRVLTGLQRTLGDVNSEYQRTTANLLNTHRQQMRAVSTQIGAINTGIREVNDGYREFQRTDLTNGKGMMYSFCLRAFLLAEWKIRG